MAAQSFKNNVIVKLNSLHRLACYDILLVADLSFSFSLLVFTHSN